MVEQQAQKKKKKKIDLEEIKTNPMLYTIQGIKRKCET